MALAVVNHKSARGAVPKGRRLEREKGKRCRYADRHTQMMYMMQMRQTYNIANTNIYKTHQNYGRKIYKFKNIKSRQIFQNLKKKTNDKVAII